MELPHRRPADGTIKHVHTTARPILEAGKLIEYIGTTMDVSERRRIEDALRLSEERTRLAVDVAQLGIWCYDPATRMVEMDARMREIWGEAPDSAAIIPLPVALQRLHPDDLTRVTLTVRGALALGFSTGHAVDFRVVRADGSQRWVAANGKTRFQAQGANGVLIGTALDITGRKKIEAALRDNEEQLRLSVRRLRLLAEAIPQLIWSYLPDGSADYCNQRWVDYTGLSLRDMRDDGWTKCLHPDDLDADLKAWREAWEQHTPFAAEARMRGVDGRFRRFLCRALPLLDERGRIVQWFGTSTDIEDSKQAAEALNRVRAELAHVGRLTAVGELAASLAHQLNQPLAAIVTNGGACLRWLDRDEPNLVEAVQTVKRIIRDANGAAHVIAHTRALLKKSNVQRAPVDITELSREMLALLRPELMKHSIAIDDVLKDDPPAVLGDRVELQQVILNLLVNAIESTANVDWVRRVVIRSEAHGTADSAGVLVAVQDTGSGIAGKKLEQIFDAFFTTKAQGMGMGLAICRSIVESHGGRLWATANADHGMTFQFVLPSSEP